MRHRAEHGQSNSGPASTVAVPDIPARYVARAAKSPASAPCARRKPKSINILPGRLQSCSRGFGGNHGLEMHQVHETRLDELRLRQRRNDAHRRLVCEEDEPSEIASTVTGEAQSSELSMNCA